MTNGRTTPWGDTRPDYGRGEVRQYILDNATMWLEEYHVDGLRFDGTVYIQRPTRPGSADLPTAASLLQGDRRPRSLRIPSPDHQIADDFQNIKWLTKTSGPVAQELRLAVGCNFVRLSRQAVIIGQSRLI